MRYRHAFPELLPARLKRALTRLESLVWCERRPVTAIEWAGSSPEHVPWREAVQRPRKPVSGPFHWGRLFDQAWFRLEIPADCADGTWHLEWKEQGESTLYLEGQPHAGLDVGHHTCPLPAGAREAWMEVMCLESAIWVPLIKRAAVTEQGCRFEGASLLRRDELAWRTFLDLSVLHQLLALEYREAFPARPQMMEGPRPRPPHTSLSVRHRRLLARLETALDIWESTGLEALGAALRDIYREFATRELTLDCLLVGHSHIDLVWLWPEKAGQFKAVHTMSTIDRLMERYPEFTFTYSQPASYRAVGERSPELLGRVRGRIAEGRWEALGALEVECDTMLPCGEALARGVLLGQDGFRGLTGGPSAVAWLPDAFGFSACLPQILRQCGVPYFFTNKVGWGTCTPFPYHSFIWLGHDGSEVLAHNSPGFDYNGQALVSELADSAARYQQAGVHGEILLPTGFGDGGGGPTEEMCERVRRLANLAGVPRARWGTVREFYAGLEARREELPRLRGELYLQYHRGVSTSHGQLKEAYRAAERALQAWEAAHCASGRPGIGREAWRRVVFAQFHDCLPGSSVREVYVETIPELWALAREALEAAALALESPEADAGAEPCLFNPLPVERLSVWEGRTLCLPPLSGGPIRSLAGPAPAPVRAGLEGLDNGRVRARFDEAGQVAELVIDGRALELEGPLCQLSLAPDFPHAHDAWDIDLPAARLGKGLAGPAKGVVESGAGNAAVAAVSFSRKISERSMVVARYSLEAGSAVLRVDLDLHFQEENALFKMLFPTRYRGRQARFGAPFGSVLRGQQAGQPQDEAQWEVPGSRWAAVCDDGESAGLAVMTEAKYGWSCQEGQLELSLVRSVYVTADDDYPGLRAPTEGRLTDLGRHRVRLALGVYDASGPRSVNPALLADTLFTPPIPYRGAAMGAGLLGLEGGESLVPCWAKPAGPGAWILRLHETLGRRGEARLLLQGGWRAQWTDLSEAPGGACVPEDGGLSFEPYQLLSLKLFRDN
jgi:alpha-mannosidase